MIRHPGLDPDISVQLDQAVAAWEALQAKRTRPAAAA